MITPSTSYAISQAAHNLTPLVRDAVAEGAGARGFLGLGGGGGGGGGATVLVLEEQMSSNVYAWQQLCARTGATLKAVPYPPDGDWTRALLERPDWGSVANKYRALM